ncbi:MAG: 50S ribosomal protein L35 [Candidatus Omnitrophica bacterium CG11_big_fil_rev_8_21_14_0_20_64_10]|nr:MAG: 50S ribosomal protein L35 [Candidatus Omnitrophica bacterium CG11_big_fil_rev_8_21_14_0_20_64_10]
MPKLKTRKAVAKRIRLTGKGKPKRKRAFKRHLLSRRSSKRKRQLRRPGVVQPDDEKRITRLLPYGTKFSK